MSKNIILPKYLNNVQRSAVEKNKVTLNKTGSIGNNCLMYPECVMASWDTLVLF